MPQQALACQKEIDQTGTDIVGNVVGPSQVDWEGPGDQGGNVVGDVGLGAEPHADCSMRLVTLTTSPKGYLTSGPKWIQTTG